MTNQIILSIPLNEFEAIQKEWIRDVLNENNQKEIVSKECELPELSTPTQTAKYLGISKVTLWKYTKAGKLQSYHLSGQIRYKRDEVLKAVQEVKNLKCKKK